jgi:hypothetical protein
MSKMFLDQEFNESKLKELLNQETQIQALNWLISKRNQILEIKAKSPS